MTDAHRWKVLQNPKQADFYTQQSCDIWCQHCCHPFTGPPVGMPITFNERKQKMVLRGVYCSLRCCLGANREMKDTRALTRPMWIRYMALKVYGVPLKQVIRPAPPRRCLTVFGGCLSLEAFRQNDQELVMQIPPILELIPEEESILEKLKHHQVTPAIRKKAPPGRKKPGLASSSYTITRKDSKSESNLRHQRLAKLGIQVKA